MQPILIVEDDAALAKQIVDLFERYRYACRAIDSFDDVDVQVATLDPALVLLDVNLPRYDGFYWCRRIRESSHVPILMVSARLEDVVKIRALGLGADDYIIKPFSPSELAARVKAHLARYERLTGSAGDAAVLRFGALEIQPQTRRVFLGGNEVILAAREFDLLLFLAQHPQVVFSKETLYDRVWELDAMGSTATVSVHINRLREKMERDPAHPQWLQTVWGAGYRFNDGM